MAQRIEIEDPITVGTLADRLDMPVSRLITELMKNGVMATVNERIDFDTAQIMVSEMGLDFDLVKKESAAPLANVRTKHPINSTGVVRPPVVAVMGHVDHGKTSLLDAIRGAKVAEHEAGGITQHITAYQISHNNRPITFLDTPGHEAFAAIREHSAHLTDLAVIVVAADDGVKPQTIEAIRFAKQAGVKIIVAITKIDKEGVDANRIKQQLAEQNLLVEEWGGDTVVVEVSAKTKQGIDNLLDMILLVADVEELRAEVDGLACGLIIEAHTEQGRGSVAHALVEEGTLKKGQFVVAGASYAKVRNLEAPDGSELLRATPSMPVVITGFKNLPQFGDTFQVVESEKIARDHAYQAASTLQHTQSRLDLSGSDLLRMINRSNRIEELKVVVKADVQGSLTSVISAVKSLDTDEVAVRIVGSGVGNINENDVYLAQTSNAIIYGFGITAPANIRRLAERVSVKLRQYDIIYELIDDVRTELGSLLAPEVVETMLGTLQIKAVFKTTKTDVICGGEVKTGKLTAPALARVLRGSVLVTDSVDVTNLKRGPQVAKEVLEGELCGVELRTKTRLELVEGDILEMYRSEIRNRSL